MNTAIKKIIWTVDPFAKEKHLQRSAAFAIKNFIQDSDCIVEPVYFFSAYFTTSYAFPIAIPKDWIQDVSIKGQNELNKLLRRVKLKNIKPLHVISEPSISLRDGVAKINEIAKRWKADLIVTSTHARKGIKRLLLGSFAETLLLHSDLPLFFINPHWNHQPRFRHILFPTDFSAESRDAFLKVLDFARYLGSEITLFHKLAYIWPPTVALATGSAPLYEDVFDRELTARQEDASKWTREAKMKGIFVTPFIDYKLGDSIADAILKKAKRKPGIIAMASESGPTKTAILGSTTRKIVRESPYPVWVLHPKSRAQEKRAPTRSIKTVQKKPLLSITQEDIETDLERIPHVKKSA